MKGRSLKWSMRKTDFLSANLTLKIGIVHVGDSKTQPVTKSHAKIIKKIRMSRIFRIFEDYTV